jgi:hypothetical protein
VGLYLVLPDRGLAQSITVGTLKGTYVTAQSGNTTVSGNLIPITLDAVETFFGNGTASGVATFQVAFPAPGHPEVFKVKFTATYSVNPDGISVSETSKTVFPDGSVEVNNFDLYPTLDGSTIAQIATDLGELRSGVLTRSSGKALLNP